MSKQQYNRNYKLTIYKKINDTEKQSVTTIQNLRMIFKFGRTTDSMDNDGIIKVFNLTTKTRDAITSKVDKDSVPQTSVKLEVGYGDELVTVVEGTCLIFSTYRAPDYVTTIEVSDGGFEQVKKRYKKSWKKGSTYDSIIKDLVNSTPDLSVGNIDNISGTLPEARTFEGLPKDILDRLGNDLGFRYIVENQEQRIDKTVNLLQRTSTEMVNFNHYSGLIQNPYYKGEYLIIETLINPVVRINTYIRINSSTVLGVFRVVGISMKGDTHANPWTMQVTLSTDDSFQNFKDINDVVSSGGMLA